MVLNDAKEGDFGRKSRSLQAPHYQLEPVVGIEPTTYGLRNASRLFVLFSFISLLFCSLQQRQPLVFRTERRRKARQIACQVLQSVARIGPKRAH
jgi:hypothetical protein